MQAISNHVSAAGTHHSSGQVEHNTPSPFQLIPDDVLREILIASLDKSKTPTISTKTVPMLLTRISSHIRCVALQTPQLWTAVHMEFGHPGPVDRDECSGARTYKKWTKNLVSRTRKQIAELRRWLIFRSGVLPLSISIKERPQSHGRRGRELSTDIMETLLTCYRRWQDISLDFHSSKLSTITALNDTNYPYLRSLRMQFYDCGDIPLHGSPLLRARNLTDLVLTDCDVSIANTMVNWANLTTLKFSRTLWEEYELEESGGVLDL